MIVNFTNGQVKLLEGSSPALQKTKLGKKIQEIITAVNAGGGGGGTLQDAYDAGAGATRVVNMDLVNGNISFNVSTDPLFVLNSATLGISLNSPDIRLGLVGAAEVSNMYFGGDFGSPGLIFNFDGGGNCTITAGVGTWNFRGNTINMKPDILQLEADTSVLINPTVNLGFFGSTGSPKVAVAAIGAQTVNLGADTIDQAELQTAINNIQGRLDALIEALNDYGIV